MMPQHKITPDLSFRHSRKVGEFLAALFDGFNRHAVRYCVLHSYESLPQYAPSDVDMAVASGDLDRAERLIFGTANALHFKVIQKLYYDIPRCFFYVVSFRDDDGKPGFVQIDILNDDYGAGRYLLRTDTILEGRRLFNGFWIPSVPVEACYLLIKKVVKGIMLPEHERKLRELLADNPADVQSLFRKEFGAKSMGVIRELIAGKDNDEKRHLIRKLQNTISLRSSILKPHLLVLRTLLLMKRVAERIAAPTGLVIAFVSPDGGGKSTLSDMIQARLRCAFRNSTRIHWRPYLLPPPRKLLTPGKWNEPELPNHEPHGKPPKGRVNSILRFFYYLADYILGFIPKILWPKIRTHLVVIERYFYDFLIDTKRYRLDIPPFLPLHCLSVIPRPDLVFLLSGPAEVIHARKQEIGLDEIQRQLDAIGAIAGKLPNSHLVNIDQSLEQEVTHVENIILSTLQERLKKRVSRG